MIEFSQVYFAYPDAPSAVLENITFSIPAGDFVLLIGPSGSGKSTLLRCINGLTPHFSGGELRGALCVAGLDPVVATPERMSRHVGFVLQDPEAQFVMDRVEDEIAFALENAAMPPEEMRVRVEETLDLLDLSLLRHRPLLELSGGEKQRVAIAAALALRPEILVLDEPTSQLDPKSAEDVLNALVRLNSDLGLTIVLAEHRLERILPFIDSMLYLPVTGSIRAGDARTVLSAIELGPPLVQLGKQLGWSPLPLTIKEGLRFSRRGRPDHRPMMSAEPEHAAEIGPMGEDAVRPSSTRSVWTLTADKLEAGYGRHAVLRNIHFEVAAGEIAVLMGRNGSGKTTLLKCIVGLVGPTRGRIRLGTEEITGQDVAAICRRVGYLPQDPNSLLFAETVIDELWITLRNHGLHPDQGGEPPVDPYALLAQLGLADKAHDYPRDLSVGERQRVALAAIMVTKPLALLLDEPTRGLDYVAKEALITLLRTWAEDGLSIVIVTHDVELAASLADRVTLMSQGEIIASGAPASVMGASPLFAPQIARLYPESGWMTVKDVLTEPIVPRG